jgi:hypothetical protein
MPELRHEPLPGRSPGARLPRLLARVYACGIAVFAADVAWRAWARQLRVARADDWRILA